MPCGVCSSPVLLFGGACLGGPFLTLHFGAQVLAVCV